MDTWILAAAAAAGGLLLIAALLNFAPARTTILIDTGATTARADMRLLWGMGPRVSAWALPRASAGNPLAVFNDPLRVGHALMTPGIAEAASQAVRSVFECDVKVANLELGVNLGDASRNLVVQTAVQAAFAAMPANIRQIVVVNKCEAPGAELRGKFELMASPAELKSIWKRFRDSRAAREFRKRLKRTPKPEKRPVREVRAS